MTLETVKKGILDNIPLVMLGMFGVLMVGIYFENKKKVE